MNGKSKTEVSFEMRNGRTYSRRKEFYDNGNLAREGLYAVGNVWSWDIPAGKVTSYHLNGNLSSEENFDEFGNRDGESIYYYDSGKVSAKHYYVKDKKVREMSFDKEGKVEGDTQLSV